MVPFGVFVSSLLLNGLLWVFGVTIFNIIVIMLIDVPKNASKWLYKSWILFLVLFCIGMVGQAKQHLVYDSHEKIVSMDRIDAIITDSRVLSADYYLNQNNYDDNSIQNANIFNFYRDELKEGRRVYSVRMKYKSDWYNMPLFVSMPGYKIMSEAELSKLLIEKE